MLLCPCKYTGYQSTFEIVQGNRNLPETKTKTRIIPERLEVWGQMEEVSEGVKCRQMQSSLCGAGQGFSRVPVILVTFFFSFFG